MITSLPYIKLKKDEDRRLRAGHLWIYSNEIDTAKTSLKNFSPGDLVQIQNDRGRSLGVGYINPHNLLCARLLSRDSNTILDKDFFKKRLSDALALRERCFDKSYYRLIFSEADFLPGLMIDRFCDHYVLQLNTAGMEKLKPILLEALIDLCNPKSILIRNDTMGRRLEQLSLEDEIHLAAPESPLKIEENNLYFYVDLREGQKTGWFYDQRTNRHRLKSYVKDKNVLDLFSYVGSFGLNAAAAGAKSVSCVDGSENATKLCQKNIALNQMENKVTAITSDVFDLLKQFKNEQKLFDVIILDPPALIKKAKDQKAGLEAYQTLNTLACELLNPNGILLSFSCSMHLSQTDLMNILRKSAIAAHRSLQIIEQLHQAPDHPIHPAIPETAYLKGFIAHLLS